MGGGGGSLGRAAAKLAWKDVSRAVQTDLRVLNAYARLRLKVSRVREGVPLMREGIAQAREVSELVCSL